MNNSRWLSGLAMVWLSACSADSSLGSGSDREERLSSSNGQRETADAGADEESASDGENEGLEDSDSPGDPDDEVPPGSATNPDPATDSTGNTEPFPPDEGNLPSENPRDDGDANLPTDSTEAPSGDGDANLPTQDPTEAPSGDGDAILPTQDPTEEPSSDGDAILPTQDPTEETSGDSDANLPTEDPGDDGELPNDPQSFCDAVAGYESKPYEEFDQSYWLAEEECGYVDDDWEAADAVVNLEVAPLAGTWRDGSGDDAVELVLDATGHGTLRYGELAELPPIEDPADPYLYDANASTGVLTLYGLRLGFAYEVFPQSGRASEMTFGVRTSEPWSEWCSLQEPKRGNICYACEIGAGLGMIRVGSDCEQELQGCYLTDTDPNAVLEVDCARIELCSSFDGAVCECNSEECRSSLSTQQRTVNLDPIDTDVLRVPNIHGAEMRYLTRVE